MTVGKNFPIVVGPLLLSLAHAFPTAIVQNFNAHEALEGFIHGNFIMITFHASIFTHISGRGRRGFFQYINVMSGM